MKRLLTMAFAALLATVSFAEAESDVLWLYWTVDAGEDKSGRSADGIEFYGANLYVVEDGSSEGRLVSTTYANGPTKALTGENALSDSPDCGQCLMSDITGIGVGASFYVELLGADLETVGWWKGDYMSMDELIAAHEALSGMVAGLQTKDPFHHAHGGQWVADQFSTVPEPTSGLLLLIGSALLALRRRRV